MSFYMKFLPLPFLVLSLFPPPFRYLLNGGTMSQGLNGIQSVSERHSVPD